MAYTSECGNAIFSDYVRTPYMYVNNTYNIPNSSYSILLVGMDCTSDIIPPDYSNTIRVFKDGVVIGDHTCYPFLEDPASCPITFDDGKICISNNWMDCQYPNNCQYNIWFNGIQTYTHTFEIGIKPYSWYTPQSAADWIINNLITLNGKITNLFSGITGWQYVRTDIVVENEVVLIKIRMNDLNIASTSLQVVPYVSQFVQALLLIAAVGTVVLVVGIPVFFRLVEWVSGIVNQGKTYTTEEVVIIVVDSIIPAQIIECENNFLPSNPVGYANCVKSVVCGAQNGLTDALALEKYGVDCITLKTNEDFDTCIAQYNIDKDLTKLQTCVNDAATKNNPTLVDAAIDKQLEGCIIRVPFTDSCMLYDKDLLFAGIAGLVIVGGYIIYNNYADQKKNPTTRNRFKY